MSKSLQTTLAAEALLTRQFFEEKTLKKETSLICQAECQRPAVPKV
jgi:hypothetical protein